MDDTETLYGVMTSSGTLEGVLETVTTGETEITDSDIATAGELIDIINDITEEVFNG